MRSVRSLSVAVIAIAVLATVALAEIRPQDDKDAAAIVTGTIADVYTRTTAFGKGGEQGHYVVKLKVDAVEKGDGIKAGDTIYVTCYTTLKKPDGAFPGAYGQRVKDSKDNEFYVPKEGTKMKVLVNKAEAGVYPALYPYGFRKADK